FHSPGLKILVKEYYRIRTLPITRWHHSSSCNYETFVHSYSLFPGINYDYLLFKKQAAVHHIGRQGSGDTENLAGNPEKSDNTSQRYKARGSDVPDLSGMVPCFQPGRTSPVF